MFPYSLAVLFVISGMGFLMMGAYLWAFLTGQFEDLDKQALLIFEARDFRLAREWELPTQCAERIEKYGPPVAPGPGEWGGRWS